MQHFYLYGVVFKETLPPPGTEAHGPTRRGAQGAASGPGRPGTGSLGQNDNGEVNWQWRLYGVDRSRDVMVTEF
jgi:hypothetical protein